MHRLRTIGALGLVLVACGGDDGASPPEPADDAGAPPPVAFDASAAPRDAGHDASSPPDAPPPDAATVDTGVLDAADATDAAVDAPDATPGANDAAAVDAATDAGPASAWTEIHGGFAGEALSIAIAPTSSRVYVLEPRAGVYVSNDLGATWTLADAGLAPAKGSFSALAMHPTMPDTLVLAQDPTTSPHVWLTADGAQSWRGVDVTAPSGKDFLVRALRFVPDVGILGGAYELASELPYVLVAPLDGSSWKPSATSGVKFNTVTSVAGASGALLFASVNVGTATTGGIYRSTDGAGARWTYVSGDIDAQDSADAYSLGQAPSAPNVVYAGVSPTNIGGVSSSTTLYKTTDGGDHWALANTGMPPRSAVLAIAVHPTDPNVAYAAIAGQGVYKTTDGGASWRYSGLLGIGVEAIAVSPSAPNVVFAGGSTAPGHTSGLYVTMTGG